VTAILKNSDAALSASLSTFATYTIHTANLIKNITDLKAAKMLAMTISHLIMV